MMNYRKYKESRNLAWQVLIQEGVSELPVNIVDICKRMGIRVKFISPSGGGDGYTTMFLGIPYIFVSEDCTPERQRFTIAHELGHILLGHVGEGNLVNREPHPEDNPMEREANVFASRLLAPACVLWALDARSPEEIAALCRISNQSATLPAFRRKGHAEELMECMRWAQVLSTGDVNPVDLRPCMISAPVVTKIASGYLYSAEP